MEERGPILVVLVPAPRSGKRDPLGLAAQFDELMVEAFRDAGNEGPAPGGDGFKK